MFTLSEEVKEMLQKRQNEYEEQKEKDKEIAKSISKRLRVNLTYDNLPIASTRPNYIYFPSDLLIVAKKLKKVDFLLYSYLNTIFIRKHGKYLISTTFAKLANSIGFTNVYIAKSLKRMADLGYIKVLSLLSKNSRTISIHILPIITVNQYELFSSEYYEDLIKMHMRKFAKKVDNLGLYTIDFNDIKLITNENTETAAS